MVNANDFIGNCDSAIINKAIRERGSDGTVVISPRTVDTERDFWLLDEAITLPENTTVILLNVKIKLSDKCRDNFFRTDNCGMGIEDPKPTRNIHIRGEGNCLLEGADHPRATGDAGKILHAPCPHFPEDICTMADWVPEERRFPDKLRFIDVHYHSYGTDALNPNENQRGDWRGIGILFANTENFSISGIRIKDSHGWGISLEACSHGRVEKIDFDSHMHKLIDGVYMNMENQDGIDLRNGCHDIVISDITGTTGDDVVALTAIASEMPYMPGGSTSTHVMHNDWSRRDKNIYNIVIRNIVAHSYLCCTVRLLPALTQIHDVIIENVIDNSPTVNNNGSTILLGDPGNYGENKPDSLRNIVVSNIICNTRKAVYVNGFLTDSVISGIINKNPNCEAVEVVRENGINNVVISNTVTKAKI